MPGQSKLPSVRRRHSGLIPNSRLVASARVRPQRQQIPASRAPDYSRVRNIAKGQCAHLLQATNELSARLKLFAGQLEHYFRNRRTQLIDRDVEQCGGSVKFPSIAVFWNTIKER
jgi:hypothetical protein